MQENGTVSYTIQVNCNFELNMYTIPLLHDPPPPHGTLEMGLHLKIVCYHPCAKISGNAYSYVFASSA